MNALYAAVIVNVKGYGVDRVFDYKIPTSFHHIKIGTRVSVPFGKRIVEGYIIELKNELPQTGYQIKEIAEVKEKQFLTPELIEVALKTSEALGCFKTSMLQAILPKVVVQKTDKKQEMIVSFFAENMSKKSKKQQEVISFLNEQTLPFEAQKLRQAFGAPVIRAMIMNNSLKSEKQLIKQEPTSLNADKKQTIFFNQHVSLRQEQKEAIAAVVPYKYQGYLLEGVTGSGKTEVFLELVYQTLLRGQQVIILVPEISLTPQTIHRFQKVLGKEAIALMHSKISPQKRSVLWEQMKNGNINIALGTRSTIFVPFDNIGLIVFDEEHDVSYKQETNPSYSAKDVGLLRAQYHQCPIVFASATPSLETYVRAQYNEYVHLFLKERIHRAPKIEIVGMNDYVGEQTYRYFSLPLLNAIKQALSRKEQVLLLMNRRGYAPLLQCSSCGYVTECPRCDVALVYHREDECLRCHYCQYEQAFDTCCPMCQQEMIPRGDGIQKITEELNILFPQQRIIRADRDTIKSYDDYVALYEKFNHFEADILIGTQMISKGFDFPNVTVVGILDIDQMLYFPDVRARERTYQLLMQTIGRSGRGMKEGRAIIQTFMPENTLFSDIQNQEFQHFAIQELNLRKMYQMPPFWHLSQLIVMSESLADAAACIQFMYQALQKFQDKATIYPPAQAPIFRKNNKYQYHILLKYKYAQPIMKNVRILLEYSLKQYPKVYSYIQVNPQRFI